MSAPDPIRDALRAARDARINFSRRLLRGTKHAVVPVKPTPNMLQAAAEDEAEWRRMPLPFVRYELHWGAMLAAVERAAREPPDAP